MKFTEKKKDLLITFLINITFLLFYGLSFDLMHETNDDFAMSFLVEGAYGERSPYLIFQNVLWGKVLVFLYTIMPRVKWYALIMYAMLFLAFSAITYALIRKHGRKAGVLTSILMLIFAGFQIYVRFQFSKIAAFATIGGMVMLLYALKYATDKIEKSLCIGLGAILSLWGSMVRFQMFAMSVVIVGGCIGLYEVWALYREKKEGWMKQLLTYVTVFGTVGVLSIGLYVIDKMHYNTPEWQEYVRFNELRSELWDYGLPEYDEYLDVYTSLGLSKTDYNFFYEWNMDPSVLDVDMMQTLVDARAENEKSFEEFTAAYPAEFLENSLYVFFLMVALFALCMDKRNWYVAIYSFMAVMTFQYYFYNIGRVGLDRIDYSMWAAALVALLYGMRIESAKDVSVKWMVVAVALSLVFSVADYERKKEDYLNYTGVVRDFYAMVREDKENLYVMLVEAPMSYYGFGFWEEARVGDLDNVYNAYGWETRLPVKESVLDKYNIENVFRDAIDNENVLFCVGRFGEGFNQYIQDNYGENVVLQYEKDVCGTLTYRLVTVESEENERE